MCAAHPGCGAVRGILQARPGLGLTRVGPCIVAGLPLAVRILCVPAHACQAHGTAWHGAPACTRTRQRRPCPAQPRQGALRRSARSGAATRALQHSPRSPAWPGGHGQPAAHPGVPSGLRTCQLGVPAAAAAAAAHIPLWLLAEHLTQGVLRTHGRTAAGGQRVTSPCMRSPSGAPLGSWQHAEQQAPASQPALSIATSAGCAHGCPGRAPAAAGPVGRASQPAAWASTAGSPCWVAPAAWIAAAVQHRPPGHAGPRWCASMPRPVQASRWPVPRRDGSCAAQGLP